MTDITVFGAPARLIIAYVLVVLLALAGVAFAWWNARNTQHRRDRRAGERLAERYQERRDAAAKRDTADS